MPLILAIEPDRRQAAKLTALAHRPPVVELVIGDTTERAFQSLGARVPDLVLTPLLLSPKDEAALADRLRELDAAGAHVQTLVIPVLGSGEGETKRSGGLFGRLRRSQESATTADGCDPSVFGDQIREYLQRAAAENEANAAAQADLDAAWAEEPPAAPLSIVADAESEPWTTDVAESLGEEPASAGAPEEEWEEVSLDAVAGGNPLVAFAPPEPAFEPQHEDLAAETMDLEAFVRELHADPSPSGVAPLHLGSYPAFPDGPTSMDDAAGRQDDDLSLILFEPLTPLEAASAHPLPFSADLDPKTLAAALESADAPAASVQGPALEVIAEKPAFVLPPAPKAEPEPAPRTAALFQVGWQDVLSAIRRDIDQLRGDDAPPAPTRPKPDLFTGPLIFPRRPAVAAQVLVREDPPAAETAAPVEPLDASAREAPPAKEPDPAIEEFAMEMESAIRANSAIQPQVAIDREFTIDNPPAMETVAGESVAPPETATVAGPSSLEHLVLDVLAAPVVAVPESPSPIVVALVPPTDGAPAEILRSAPAAPKPDATLVEHAAHKTSKLKKKRRHAEPQAADRPLDDWGFFDPQQVDFGALLAKLNEITDRDQHSQPGQ